MLELKKITKTYVTGEEKVQALKGINISFRESEFVSILGQSGCGKTTLLNIIGGLDRYTTGDLIINERSTKEFKDRDWDTYRNHSVGFVFQNYNLIPHQTVLSNVELALTLSGVSKAERRKRALEVLEKVGLKDQVNKKPNQMSGGQMQRVAIARALINDPDILLADEPTGALDSETSIQIMDLLKEIASEKLVIMVTHNPELAEQYSTRIVKLLDGNIIDDSNPFDAKKEKKKKKEIKKTKKTYMSFMTALSLSLNNLMTKKGRTILTAFAGSIGIIGIALILSLSSGVRNYISRVEEDTLSSYPIQIDDATIDMTAMMDVMTGNKKQEEHELDKIYSNDILGDVVSSVTSKISKNNLVRFKEYIESDKTDISTYANAIQYGYDIDLQIYNPNTEEDIIQANPSTIMEKIGFGNDTMSSMSLMSQYNVFTELMDNETLLKTQYDVVAGSWPTKYNEVVLIVDENNNISDYTLYALGLKDQKEIENLFKKVAAGEQFTYESTAYEYNELIGLKFKLVLNTDYYTKQSDIWINRKDDYEYMKKVIKDAEDITIVGIIRPNEEAILNSNHGLIGYTKDLTEYVVEKINDKEIVKEQQKDSSINIFTGLEFNTDNKQFDMSSLTPEQQAYLSTLSQEELAQVISAYMETYGATYEDNLRKLGVVDLDSPSSIYIYPKDFKSKEEIERIISDYNEMVTKEGKEEDSINYTDMVGLMMSGVTTIIDIISYVLIAFVSISLVVSSIMIGIITYISVLERIKEIGILRAIGASKKDISRVFRAETVIEGLAAGLFGILITIILNIPINIIIKNITGISNISSLPIVGAIVLVLISVLLTLIAGLFPARMASRKDPVEALRTE